MMTFYEMRPKKATRSQEVGTVVVQLHARLRVRRAIVLRLRVAFKETNNIMD